MRTRDDIRADLAELGEEYDEDAITAADYDARKVSLLEEAIDAPDAPSPDRLRAEALAHVERFGAGMRVLTVGQLADEAEGIVAFTVIGVYVEGDDLHQRYATTVHTDGGPGAAEQLAQEACRRDNGAQGDDDLIEVAAVVEGEVRVVA